MVAGRLAEKKGYFYIVLSYKINDKRKESWFKTGLKVHGNKRKAEELLKAHREQFDIKTGKLKSQETEINAPASMQYVKKSDMLVGEYMLYWLEKIKNTIAVTTYAGYKTNIIGAIAPYFNERNIALKDLNGDIIDEYYDWELKRGLSANTVIHHHANLRKALEEAFRENLIPYTYADKAHRPKMVEYIADYFSRDELLALFNSVKGKKIEFAVLMASYYGLRRSEIIGLKWSCFNFEEKKFTIKHTVTECSLDGKVIRVANDSAKTKKSIRSLPLVEDIEKMLIRMKNQENYNKEFFGNKYNHKYDQYIYKHPDGELMKPGYVTQYFKRYVINKHPEWKAIRFHDLRHSCATLLRNQGVPLEDIQKWLGHSQITTTEKLYAHFEYKTHLKSAQKIANAFADISLIFCNCK